MASTEPRIDFSKLKHFPELQEESTEGNIAAGNNNSCKIATQAFIESAYQLIDNIESFGMLFTPIVKDMRGNVKRLETKFKENEQSYHFLEDMILYDAAGNENANVFDTVTEGLLWLKRALDMIEQFFRNMLEDTDRSDNVKHHLKKAYEDALLPYHGFFAQKGFQLLQHYVPTRTTLLGPHDANSENLIALKSFLVTFRANIDHLNVFFEKHNLNKTYKV